MPSHPTPTTILLVRHGENEWVKSNKLAGRTPGVHLNDTGRAQARRLAARLAGWPVAAVYSSPLERCLETAELLASPHGLPVQQHEGLLEADIGEWQGRSIDSLKEEELWKIVQVTPSFAQFPGGETMRAMQERMVSATHEIVAAHPEQIVIVCSHSDMIKSALAYFLGAHLDHFQRIHVSPAGLSMILFSRYGPHVVRVNDTGELNPPPPKKEDVDSSQDGNHKLDPSL